MYVWSLANPSWRRTDFSVKTLSEPYYPQGDSAGPASSRSGAQEAWMALWEALGQNNGRSYKK